MKGQDRLCFSVEACNLVGCAWTVITVNWYCTASEQGNFIVLVQLRLLKEETCWVYRSNSLSYIFCAMLMCCFCLFFNWVLGVMTEISFASEGHLQELGFLLLWIPIFSGPENLGIQSRRNQIKISSDQEYILGTVQFNLWIFKLLYLSSLLSMQQMPSSHQIILSSPPVAVITLLLIWTVLNHLCYVMLEQLFSLFLSHCNHCTISCK